MPFFLGFSFLFRAIPFRAGFLPQTYRWYSGLSLSHSTPPRYWNELLLQGWWSAPLLRRSRGHSWNHSSLDDHVCSLRVFFAIFHVVRKTDGTMNDLVASLSAVPLTITVDGVGLINSFQYYSVAVYTLFLRSFETIASPHHLQLEVCLKGSGNDSCLFPGYSLAYQVKTHYPFPVFLICMKASQTHWLLAAWESSFALMRMAGGKESSLALPMLLLSLLTSLSLSELLPSRRTSNWFPGSPFLFLWVLLGIVVLWYIP